ncbi:MAG TPA: PrsW family glutamic-type intramembrane protease [Ramlibacter sp.]|nr:PrsW family glutamic-type intramembrane protease [Ramlibacter sp.]
MRLTEIAVGLLPVLIFLGALLYMDSYKLVKLRYVIMTVVAGALTGWASYFANGAILSATGMDWTAFTRYVAPLVEESFKGLIILALIRLRRIGFLVDAAIFGFAVGTGFSILENIYYFVALVGGDAGIGTWIIRGFGTAIMHGGATAILAVTTLNYLDQPGQRGVLALVPAMCLAYVVHSLYNHALLPPIYQTFVVLVALPALLVLVFQHSEKSVGSWLGSGFDADARLLELLDSGQFSDSPMGMYLMSLKEKFHGPVVADILCYVRLHTELALRAKGVLMMRENGFDAPIDQLTRAKFTEMRYLEGSIGKTGLLAIDPMLHLSRKDLWQLNLLEK